MLETDHDILKHEHGEKFMRFLFVILIWVFSLPKKSLFAHCSFDSNRNKYDYYIGYDCMKKFCKQFKEHAAKNN